MQDRLAQLGSRLFIADGEAAADATLVLGMRLWQRPVARAVSLHAAGRSGLLVFTGAHGEGESMAAHARQAGIGELLVEPHATNTRENMALSRQLLQQRGMLRPGGTIAIVAIAFHMRRALVTAQDIFGADMTFCPASYDSVHYPREAWQDSPRGRQDVLAELRKLASYYPGLFSADEQDTLMGLAA